jgi:hypothetical protein
MGEGRTGGVMGSWVYISGPKVYILDMNGYQCLRKRMAGVLSALAWPFSAYGHGIGFGETRHLIPPDIIHDLQAFKPAHNLNMKL